MSGAPPMSADIGVVVESRQSAHTAKTETHEEEDLVCLYICSWVEGVMVKKTLADTVAVVELINPKLAKKLDLPIYEMDEEWTLQLADDRLARVKHRLSSRLP